MDFEDVFGGPPSRVLVKDGRTNYHSNVDGAAEYRFGWRGSSDQRRRSEVMIRKPIDFVDDRFRYDDFDNLRSASTISSILDELGKKVEVPVWNSFSHRSGRSGDKYPSSPAAPSSRFLRHLSQSRRDHTTEDELCDGETPLYVEFSLTSDGTVKVLKNVIYDDEEDIVKQKLALSNTPANCVQFHSCKWANEEASPITNIEGEVKFRPRICDTRIDEPGESLADGVSASNIELQGSNEGCGAFIIQGKTNEKPSPGKTNGRERVKELVAMFNQTSSSKSKLRAGTLNQSLDGNSNGATKPTVVENLKINESGNQDSGKEPSTLVHKDTSFKQVDVSSQGSVPDSYKDGNDSSSDPIDEFEVKELTREFEESDAKIKQWSKGKEGNIRSLLSTMQQVLWPGSGWKPVALVDIIETNQVRKIYQRALLCVHPDKVQQKGVAENQRYIAEKVYDILQESWNHFNTLTSL